MPTGDETCLRPGPSTIETNDVAMPLLTSQVSLAANPTAVAGSYRL